MTRPAAETTSPYEEKAVQRSAEPTSGLVQRGGDAAMGRHIQARYGEAPGVIPIGSTNLLQRRLARLTADRLPLLHFLQRRWRPAADTAAAPDLELYYRAGAVNPQTSTGFHEIASLPVTPAIPARPPRIAQTRPGGAHTVVRQALPQAASTTSGPNATASASPVDWGAGLLRRHLAGTVAPVAQAARMASTPGQLPRRLVARTIAPSEGTAGQSSSPVAPPVVFPFVPPEAGHRATLTATTQPSAGEALSQPTQPLAGQALPARPTISRAAATLTGEQDAGPVEPTTVLPLARTNPRVARSAVGLSVNDQPSATADPRPAGMAPHLPFAEAPAPSLAHPRDATQTTTPTALTGTAAAPLPPSAAMVQRAQPAAALSGEARADSTIPPLARPLVTAVPRASDGATRMGMPIVQRRRGASAQGQAGATVQATAATPEPGSSAAIVQPLALSNQPVPPAVPPALQTQSIGDPITPPAVPTAPFATMAPAVRPVAPLHGAELEAGAPTPQTTSGRAQHAALIAHVGVAVAPIPGTPVKPPTDQAALSTTGAELHHSAPAMPDLVMAKAILPAAPHRSVTQATNQAAGGDGAIRPSLPGLPAVVTPQPAQMITPALDLLRHAPTPTVTAAKDGLPDAKAGAPDRALLPHESDSKTAAASALMLLPTTAQAESLVQPATLPLAKPVSVDSTEAAYRINTPPGRQSVATTGGVGRGNELRQRHLTARVHPIPEAVPPAGPTVAQPTALSPFALAQRESRAPVADREPSTAALPLRHADPEQRVRRQSAAHREPSTGVLEDAVPTWPVAEPASNEHSGQAYTAPPSLTLVQSARPLAPAGAAPDSQLRQAAPAEAAPPALPTIRASALPLRTPFVARRSGQPSPTRASEDARRLPLSKVMQPKAQEAVQTKAQAATVALFPGDLPLTGFSATLVQRYLTGASASLLQPLAAATRTDAAQADHQDAEAMTWLAPAALLQRALTATASGRAQGQDSVAPLPLPADAPPPTLHRLVTTIARATEQPAAPATAPSPLSTMTTPITPAVSSSRSAAEQIDVERLADQVYALIEQRLMMERESLGL